MNIVDINSKVWSMANMGQDVKEAMTGGSVAVVGKNTVLTENIVDGQVTYSKTNFLSGERINLSNPSETEKGYFNGAGDIYSPNGNTSYTMSGYIPVTVGETYVFICNLATNGLAFYNTSKVGISKPAYTALTNNYRTITIPEGVSYVRFTNNGTKSFIAKGSTEIEYCDYDNFPVSYKDIKFENLIKSTIEERIQEGVLYDDSVKYNNVSFLKVYNLNKFNSDTSELNKLILDSSGNENENYSGAYRSALIPVNSSAVYYTNCAYGINGYDSGGTKIGVLKKTRIGSSSIFTITTQPSCKFIKISGQMTTQATNFLTDYPYDLTYSKYNTLKVVIEDELLKKAINNIKLDNWFIGKTYCRVGDSISTPGDSYFKYVCENLKMNSTEMPNMSGSLYARHSTNGCIYDWINDLDETKIDIITVMGGRNDISNKIPLGNFTDRGFDTFYGALHNTFKLLATKFKGKKIGVMSPVQRLAGAEDYEESLTYIRAIEKVAGCYNIPFYDLFIKAFSGEMLVESDFTNNDKLHPTANIHKIYIAPKVKEFLLSLVSYEDLY